VKTGGNNDFGFGLRLLRKSPGFALVAIFIMVLGIGANTAIFSIVQLFCWNPLLFAMPIASYGLAHPPQKSFPGMTIFAVSAANFLDRQKQNHVFDQVALYFGAQFDITGAGKPEAIMAGTVSPEFFPSLDSAASWARLPARRK
jgi:putative ABC transport system permease protein